MKCFATNATLFRTLVVTLILVPLLQSFVSGKSFLSEIKTNGKEGSKKKANNCLVENEIGFPQTVELNVTMVNTAHATHVINDVSTRSTSPWDYSVNQDPNRFPNEIAEAKCRHEWCVDSTGQESHSLISVPIKQEILVLKREQKGCKQTYRLEKHLVTVGCTCAKAVVRSDWKNNHH